MSNRQSKRQIRREAQRAAQLRQRQKWIGFTGAFVMVVAGLLLVISSSGDSGNGDSGDQAAPVAPAPPPAPDFELEAATGDTVKLSDYLGQPVALIFMHTY